MNIALISSSTRIGRKSHRAALALQQQLESSGIAVSIIDLVERPLPLFTERYGLLPEDQKTEHMHSISADLQQAKGIIFITPEYNGGISGALKNLIETFGRAEFDGKPIGVCTVSDGALGGIRAAYQLQQTILSIQAFPHPRMLTIGEIDKHLGENGAVISETFQAKLDQFTSKFLEFVRRF